MPSGSEIESMAAENGTTTMAGLSTTLSTTVADNATSEVEICTPLSMREGNAYSVLTLVVPNNGANWEERTDAYWAFFYIMLVVFSVLYLCLAVGCILLLIKRHMAQRFRVRTFLAIDVALMVLGFSRVLFLILDPWGQSGFCDHIACIVVSRLIGSLAFPSLTASYTLVLITLWISARVQVGMSCVQQLKKLIPLCFIHYGVAIVFEIIGSLPVKKGMIVVILLVSCEAAFALWGFLVCFSFLITGHRLLKLVEKSARSSSMICKDSPNLTRHQLIERSKLQSQGQDGKKKSQTALKLKYMLREHHRRAIRKVSRITYITVLLGMLYSVVSFVNLILICLSLFFGCPGYLNDQTPQNPGVWLTLRYISFTIELLLAVLLTYSISDYQPIVNLLCCGMRKVGSRQQSPSGQESCTIESENPSKPFPTKERSPPSKAIEAESCTKEDSLSIDSYPNSPSPLSPKSHIFVNSHGQPSKSPSSKRVTILENTSSSYNRTLTSNGHHPKTESPLTVSYGVSDNCT